VKIARDREEEWTELRVLAQSWRAGDEAQPGFLEQIFRDLTAPRQPREEVEQAPVEPGINDVERAGIAGTDARHEVELQLPVHEVHNARGSQM